MSTFQITSTDQAEAIRLAYHRCGSCDECPPHTPEGWRGGYLYERATAYLESHRTKAGYRLYADGKLQH